MYCKICFYLQAKNAEARAAVKKADVVGITISGQPGVRTLPKSFIDEALIISDLFDLNEYSAVELLLAGELCQVLFQRFPVYVLCVGFKCFQSKFLTITGLQTYLLLNLLPYSLWDSFKEM